MAAQETQAHRALTLACHRRCPCDGNVASSRPRRRRRALPAPSSHARPRRCSSLGVGRPRDGAAGDSGEGVVGTGGEPDRVQMRQLGRRRGVAVAIVDAKAVISGGVALAAAAGRLVTVPEVLYEVQTWPGTGASCSCRHRWRSSSPPLSSSRKVDTILLCNFRINLQRPEQKPQYSQPLRLPFPPSSPSRPLLPPRLHPPPNPDSPLPPRRGHAHDVTKFAREIGDLQTLSDVDMKIIALAYMLEAEVHGTSHLREHPPPLHVVSVWSLKEAPLPAWGSNVPNLAELEALDKMSEAQGDLNSRILPLNDLENKEILTSETNNISETPGDEEFQPSRKDACIPWEDDENNEGWLPAVSHTTHRKYLRRKARRDALKGSEQGFDTISVATSVDDVNDLSENCLDPVDAPSVAPEKKRGQIHSLESEEEHQPKLLKRMGWQFRYC